MAIEDINIFLPTRGRVDRQVTLHHLSDAPVILGRMTIVCHPGEEARFRSDWGVKCKIMALPVDNIGEVRQQCMEQSDKDYIVFIDDSLNFHVRAESGRDVATKYPLKVMTNKHFTKMQRRDYLVDMFGWIIEMLQTDDYGMVGISRRSGNQNVEGEVVYNSRICSFWGINRKLFNTLDNGPRFSDMVIKEDFYIALHFLTNGIPIVLNYKYAYGRAGGANSIGGCSIYRKLALSNESAFILKRHFPGFVNVRVKSTKSWQGDFGDKAYDVMVNWKKAYEFGKRRKERHEFF